MDMLGEKKVYPVQYKAGDNTNIIYIIMYYMYF